MNAYALEVNNEFLDLPNGSLRYELINSLFITELYRGDYSFPLVLPPTQKNLLFFGFVNYIDTEDKVVEYDNSFLHLFGLPKFKTKLRVTRGSRNGISIVLNSGIKSLVNAEKKLSEVLKGKTYFLGNNQSAILSTAKRAAENGDWKVYGFSFVPFSQPNFYDGKNPDFLGICNRVDSYTGDLLGNNEVSVNNKYNLVPFLFLFFVMNEIFKDAGLIPSGSFWDDDELSKLLLYSNKSIDIRPTTYNTFVRSDAPWDYTVDHQRLDMFLGPPGTYDNIHAWDNTPRQYIVTQPGGHVFNLSIDYKIKNSAIVSPKNLIAGSWCFMVNGVIQSEFEMENSDGTFLATNYYNFTLADVGTSICFEWKKSTALFQGSTYITVDEAHLFVNLTPDPSTLPSININDLIFSEHVADIKVSDFLARVKKYGVNFKFDKPGQVIMDKAITILNAVESIDVTGRSVKDYEINMEDKGKGTLVRYSFPEEEKAELDLELDKYVGEFWLPENMPYPNQEGTWCIITTTNEIYQVIKDGLNPNEWKQVGYNYKPYKVGNGEAELNIGLAPMQMCIAKNEGGSIEQQTALMPFYPGIGSSQLFGLGTNSFDFRVVFWRGYNQDGNLPTPYGGKYILASTSLRGINKNIVGNMCFRLDKKEAVPRVLSDKLLEILNKSEIYEKDLDVDPLTLDKIESTSKIDVNHNVFIVKSISIVVSKVAKLKAYLYKI